VEQVAGDLKEIDKKKMQSIRKQQQGQAQTLEDLYKLGKARGYKYPRQWAKHVFNRRQAKRLRGY
jgi:hypothetical protein